MTAHNENPDSYALYRPWSPSYGAKGGNATDDKCFILSWTEARDYLDGKLIENDIGKDNYNQKLLCIPTVYAKAKGVSTYSNGAVDYPFDTADCCFWWLRSPGPYQASAAYVYGDGAINYGSIMYDKEAVRPAILID